MILEVTAGQTKLTNMAGGNIDEALEERAQGTVLCGLRHKGNLRMRVWTIRRSKMFTAALLTASSSSLVGELGTSST